MGTQVVGDFNLSWENGPWTVINGLADRFCHNRQDLRDDEGTALDENSCRTSFFRLAFTGGSGAGERSGSV